MSSTTNPSTKPLGALPGAGRLGHDGEAAADRPSHAGEVAAGRRRRARLPRWNRVASPLLLLAIWQLVSVTGLISAAKLPPPTKVLSTAYTLITTDSPAYGTLQHALLASLERVAIGFALGGGCALILATVAGLSRFGEHVSTR